MIGLSARADVLEVHGDLRISGGSGGRGSGGRRQREKAAV